MPQRLANGSTAADLDATDRTLLRLLADDARMPVADLAREIGLSAPSTAERLRRLEQDGVIRAFTIDVDHRRLGYALRALVRIRPLGAVADELRERPGL